MKVFVSVPMSGRMRTDIINDIGSAVLDYTVRHPNESNEYIDNLDCVIQNGDCVKCPSLLYLSEAIKKMAYCDEVIFAGDWTKARGCIIESMVYQLYFSKSFA